MNENVEQPGLFNQEEGSRLKEEGIARAQRNRSELVAIARVTAEEIARCRPDRSLTVDAVYAEMQRGGYEPPRLGNAWGSVFRGLWPDGRPKWEFTGEWRRSSRSSNHCRMVRVWRLK